MKEDIKLKVYTKEEAYWREIRESSDNDILKLKRLLKFQEAVVKMANEKIKLEGGK